MHNHFTHSAFFVIRSLLLVFLIFFGSSQHALAELNCEATPKVGGKDYPGRDAMILSNKLARPAGKAEFAPGQLLIVEGILQDESCVPVSNARVELWQTNPSGKYGNASKAELLTAQPVFAGTGVAITDNMGRFTFETLYPGAYGNHAPHLHIRILHDDFKPLQTTLFFEGEDRNAKDPYLKPLGQKTQERLMLRIRPLNLSDVNQGVLGEITLTLTGKSPWKGYQ